MHNSNTFLCIFYRNGLAIAAENGCFRFETKQFYHIPYISALLLYNTFLSVSHISYYISTTLYVKRQFFYCVS